MTFKYFLYNGQLKDSSEAVIGLGNIEYQYGFGVYESLRVVEAYPYFIEEHAARLIHSAEIISLEHSYSQFLLIDYIRQLIAKNEADNCNIKILLIGGKDASDAKLYMQCLNPLYVDRQLYKEGAKCVTQNYERMYPQAKTLNMLGSYLAYKKASGAGAYDSLLIDNEGFIREGTRTNFFGMKANTIYSPPKDTILEGVMRENVIKYAIENGYGITEKQIDLSDISDFDCCFLTSSSSKILPISLVDDLKLDVDSMQLRNLMSGFDSHLKAMRSAN
jgi:branched-chain amino acid aminotransferase